MAVTRRNKALVVGGLGVTGRYLVEHLTSLPEWDVVAIARSAPSFKSRAAFVQVDITDRDASRKMLSPLTGVTHIFHAARRDQGDLAEQARTNLAMLRNVVDVIEDVSPHLQHINLMHGMKAYGNLLGPFKTPAVETDPRVLPPVVYYEQEDFVQQRQRGKRWSWSTLRPGPICGVTIGYSGNLVSILGIYGSMCRELGTPLWFPGTIQAFAALRQACDARLLAKAAAWVSTHETCANQFFNVSNGDLFRWEHLWPSIAAFFGVEPAGPLCIRLEEYMRDKAPVWDRMVARHKLAPYPFSTVASWTYSDTFHKGWDSFANETRLRGTGFGEVMDTRSSMLDMFERLREIRIIP